MNVRFFAGTKKQYLELSKHNPVALYFCADTRELYWGDLLLSDGIRAVPSKNDLPIPANAADGVIYYVVDSREGYVVSANRATWLRVIYAPAADISAVPDSEASNTAVSVAAMREIENTIYEKLASIEALNKVKEISFAGVMLDRTDGVFSIDRDSALKALGISFAEGPIDTANKVVTTKAYVDNKIASIPEVDLSNHVTKPEIAGLASEKFVEEFVKQQILEAELNDKEADLSIFYTKSEVDKLIPDVSDFATKTELADAIKSIEHPIVDLTGYATEEFVKQQIVEIEHPDISHLATREELKTAIDSIEHPTVDLAGYVKREELDSFIKEIPDNYVTEEELEAKGYLTEVPEVDLTDYALKTDIPSVEGLASEEYVNTKISELEIPAPVDLSGYAKLSDIPSHDEFATKADVQTVVDRVDALNVVAAKERYEVIRVPGLEVTYGSDEIRLNTAHIELARQNVGEGGEANAYYIGIKIYAPANAESIRQNITSAPGIQEGKEKVPFTATDVDSYGRKYSTVWVKCAIYQNDAWLNYGMNSTPAKCLGYYCTAEWYDIDDNVIENDSIHVVFTNDGCHYSNISDAASRRFVAIEEAIAAIEVPEIPDTSKFITMEDVEAKGYITNIDLDGKADEGHTHDDVYAKREELFSKDYNDLVNKPAIPSVEGLATEEFVRGEIEKLAPQEAEIYKVDYNAPNYAAAVEAYNNGKVLVLINAAPDVNSYAVMNYVSDKYITFTKFLMSRSEAYGAFNTYYLSPANSWVVSKEVILNKVEANVEGEGEAASKLTSIRIGKELYSLPNTDGLASIDYVDEQISGLAIPTTVSELENDAGYITASDIPEVDLANYYNKAEADTAIHNAVASKADVGHVHSEYALVNHEHEQYLTDHQDISHLAEKAELFSGSYNDLSDKPNIPSIDGLATESYVDSGIAAHNISAEAHNDIRILVDEINTRLNTVANSTDEDLDQLHEIVAYIKNNKDLIDGITTGKVSVSDIIDDLETNATNKPLSAAQGVVLKGLIDTLQGELDLHGHEISEVAGLQEALDSKADAEHSHDKYLTEQALADYAKTEDLAGFITEIPAEYITEEELNAKGYLTEHQPLNEYAKKSEIPSVENFVEKQYVDNAIAALDIPEVPVNVSAFSNDAGYLTELPEHAHDQYLTKHQDISGLATVEQLATKADVIPFTEDKFVTKAVGNFAVGDSVKGLSVAEILAKLLGLSDEPINPDEPDIPDEPTGVVETILANKLPMYQLAGDGVLAELPYNYITITADEAAASQQKPTQSGFYQIINENGDVIESGYQQIQVKIPNVPFMIALPNIIDYPNQVSAQVYNELQKTWSATSITLTSDAEEIAFICDDEGCSVPEAPDGYILWASKNANIMSSESIYRFSITEVEEA